MNRKAKIRIEEMYIVDLYEDGVLVESRKLAGESISYAKDVVENWESGIIKTPGVTSESSQSV